MECYKSTPTKDSYNTLGQKTLFVIARSILADFIMWPRLWTRCMDAFEQQVIIDESTRGMNQWESIYASY